MLSHLENFERSHRPHRADIFVREAVFFGFCQNLNVFALFDFLFKLDDIEYLVEEETVYLGYRIDIRNGHSLSERLGNGEYAVVFVGDYLVDKVVCGHILKLLHFKVAYAYLQRADAL